MPDGDSVSPGKPTYVIVNEDEDEDEEDQNVDVDGVGVGEREVNEQKSDKKVIAVESEEGKDIGKSSAKVVESTSEREEEINWTFKEALRTFPFWAFSLGQVCIIDFFFLFFFFFFFPAHSKCNYFQKIRKKTISTFNLGVGGLCFYRNLVSFARHFTGSS